MSTLPSKPLPFLAELGVLGTSAPSPLLGKGKGRAPKIPSHLNLGFNAFFYDLPTNGSQDPSTPYVGTIDLEQHYIDQMLGTGTDSTLSPSGGDVALPNVSTTAAAPLPRFPGYRLPGVKGQIQLVIKNSNRTPIKLFLVPYDLADVKPGQKTFLRQKCYELDSPAGAVRSESERRGNLRFAVHLQFCSPPERRTRNASRGPSSDQRASSPVRLYLHKTIRVVFASPRTG